MAEQLKAIPLSELEEISEEKKGDFWLFASTQETNGVFESGRYNLSRYMNDVNSYLQLERRIALTMERNTHTMFMGEEMTIYDIDPLNVKKLTISINNGDPIELALPFESPFKIAAKSLVTFGIERTTADPVGYLFIYAKAKTL